MGKARPSNKSAGDGKVKSRLVSSIKNASAQSQSPLNTIAASGKITKTKAGKKKNVAFRSSLTDVLAAEQVLQTADKIRTKIPSKLKTAESIQLLSNSEETSFRRTLKSQIKVKKVRHQIKREAFQKKIELLKQAEIDKQEAKKRQQTVIVGDLNPLMDALTSALEPTTDLDKLKTFVSGHKLKDIQTMPKSRKINMKKRQKEIADGLDFFASGLKMQF